MRVKLYYFGGAFGLWEVFNLNDKSQLALNADEFDINEDVLKEYKEAVQLYKSATNKLLDKIKENYHEKNRRRR
jgi:hypothetical protein